MHYIDNHHYVYNAQEHTFLYDTPALIVTMKLMLSHSAGIIIAGIIVSNNYMKQ